MAYPPGSRLEYNKNHGIPMDCATVLENGNVLVTEYDGVKWCERMPLEDWLILADGSTIYDRTHPSDLVKNTVSYAPGTKLSYNGHSGRETAIVLTDSKVMLTMSRGQDWREKMLLEDWLILAGSKVTAEPPAPRNIFSFDEPPAPIAEEDAEDPDERAELIALLMEMRAAGLEYVAKMKAEAAAPTPSPEPAAAVAEPVSTYPYNPPFLAPKVADAGVIYTPEPTSVYTTLWPTNSIGTMFRWKMDDNNKRTVVVTYYGLLEVKNLKDGNLTRGNKFPNLDAWLTSIGDVIPHGSSLTRSPKKLTKSEKLLAMPFPEGTDYEIASQLIKRWDCRGDGHILESHDWHIAQDEAWLARNPTSPNRKYIMGNIASRKRQMAFNTPEQNAAPRPTIMYITKKSRVLSVMKDGIPAKLPLAITNTQIICDGKAASTFAELGIHMTDGKPDIWVRYLGSLKKIV